MAQTDVVTAIKWALRSTSDQDKTDRLADFLKKAKISNSQLFFPGIEKVINGEDGISEIEPDDHNATYVRFTEFLYKYGSVGEFQGREDIGYDVKDFKGLTDKACLAMECYDEILQKYNAAISTIMTTCDYSKAMQNALSNVITVHAFKLGMEHYTSQPWTTGASLQVSRSLMDTLMAVHGCSSVRDMLSGKQTKIHSQPLFKSVLEEVCFKLTKSRWKQNPGAQSVFVQCLLSVRFPDLSDYLDWVFPASLLITDDHQLPNKLQGIGCLSHIITNCSSTELRWHGRADVMYDTLQRFMYTHDAQLFDVLFPCLLQVLEILEPVKTGSHRCHSKHDDIMQRLLQDMELENRLNLRRVYAKHLPSLIHVMGIGCVKHYQHILRGIFGYMEVYDGPQEESRLSIMECLKMIIIHTWPRIPSQVDSILKSLLKMMFDLSCDHTMTPEEVKEQVLLKAAENVNLLKEICPEYITSCLSEIENLELNPKFMLCINNVLFGINQL